MGFFDTLKKVGKEMLDEHIENTKQKQMEVDKLKVKMDSFTDDKLLDIKNAPSGTHTVEETYAAAQLLGERERN